MNGRRKHPGGRPLKFQSVDQIQKLIDEYFANTIPAYQTITGLALALDTDRVTLINYENRDEFFNTIKIAKTRIEHAYELSLRANGRAGDIFGLKNFGWKDRSEVENSGEQKVIVETRKFTNPKKHESNDDQDN